MTTELIEVDLEALKRMLIVLNDSWYRISSSDSKGIIKRITCLGCFQSAFTFDGIKHLDFCGVPDAIDLSTRLWED